MKLFSVGLFLFLSVLVNSDFLYAQKWQSMGPSSVPRLLKKDDQSLRFAQGIGRVSIIESISSGKKKKSEPSLLLGAPYGGLWQLNSGASKWIPAGTDQLQHLGISDYGYSKKNLMVRYLITGDPDCIMDPNGPALSSEFCQSRGILKSVDAGVTWSDSAIGKWYDAKGNLQNDFWNYPSRKVARRILVSDKCPKELTTVIHTWSSSDKTYDGMIYRSQDGGLTWYQTLYVKDGFLKDLDYKPGSGKVIYTSGRGVYKSEDRACSWQHLDHNGLPPDSIVKRCELAISPSNPDVVYVLVIYNNARNSDIFISDDDGQKFSRIMAAFSSPEWRTAMAVDPSNAELVYFTSGNRVHKLYRKNNEWRQEYTGGFIHDDVHELCFLEGNSKLFASTDGGLYASTDQGKTWEDLREGLDVAECWSVAVSQTGPVNVLAGLQDCGTVLYKTASDSSAGWWIVRGGDGMAAAFDSQNEYIMYANDGNNHILSRSIDGGSTWSKNLMPVRNEVALYQRPFIAESERKGVIYTGMHDVYRSNDYGDTWQKYSDFSFVGQSEKLVALANSPLDTSLFYAAFSNPAWSNQPEKKLFRTKDAGKTWADISHSLSGVSWANITSLVADYKKSEVLYTGFRASLTFKVMKSSDEGNTWQNYSDGLPLDADVNNLILDKDSQGTLYAATHKGVYKRSENDQRWTRLGEGLPSVMVSGLDIRFDNRTLFAGTHGRGVWYIQLDNDKK